VLAAAAWPAAAVQARVVVAAWLAAVAAPRVLRLRGVLASRAAAAAAQTAAAWVLLVG
jgi:hypothetical protein